LELKRPGLRISPGNHQVVDANPETFRTPNVDISDQEEVQIDFAGTRITVGSIKLRMTNQRQLLVLLISKFET